jgi:hypothetical protein
MGKKEISFVEKRIRKIRRSRNLSIFALIVLFLGFNGYVGYNAYSIVTVNDFQTQVMANNATITITMNTTKIGNFVFGELGIPKIIGQASMPFSDLIGVFGGSGDNNGESNDNPEQAQENNTESQNNNTGESNPFGPLGSIINISVFEPLFNLRNNTAFFASINDSSVLEKYDLTLADTEFMLTGFKFVDLFSTVIVSLVLPLTIQNPSYLNLEMGTIVVSLVGESSSKDLINYKIPTLAAQSSVTAQLPLTLELTAEAIAAMFGGEGGDPMGAMFGGATKIQINLSTSLLYLYPISISATVDLAGMMGGGENTENNGGNP